MRIECLYFLTLLLALRSFARKKLNDHKLIMTNCADSETHLRVDMRYDTTLGDNDIAKELVQPFGILKHEKNQGRIFDSLFIISDGKL